MKKHNKIMVIGAGGTLGNGLIKSLVNNQYDIIGVDINENNLAYLSRLYNVPFYIEDIRETSKITNIIESNNIDLVINCAALKHVRWCELNIIHAVNINTIANIKLMEYLKSKNKKFIFISSDKAINPTNIYALTKQFSDYVVKRFGFKLIRGVNFLYSKGSVLDIWEKQRVNNIDFTLVNEDCIRYFILVDQMVDLIVKAIQDEDENVIEYCPDIVYGISIRNLFKSYLALHNITDPKIKYFGIPANEKVCEQLNFNPIIKQIDDIKEISVFIKKAISLSYIL